MTHHDLLQGTLDMLILRVLSRGTLHGWGIAERIALVSKATLSVGEGSLYPALYRMQGKGWIASEWGHSENKRRARFYRITRAGRKQLELEQATWHRTAAAVATVLKPA
jgi:PadR family transcriptional regulator PadR